MKTQYQYNMMDAIYKVKVFIEGLYQDFVEMVWLYTRPLHSYNDEHNTVEFYVLQGEPPRGYIIASYALGTVKGFDIHMNMRMGICVSGLAFPEGI